MSMQVRCVEGIRSRINSSGTMQKVIDYSLKNGQKQTEIITNLVPSGKKTKIATLEMDQFNNIEKITEKVTGEAPKTYLKYPNGKGIQMYVAGRPQCYYPTATLERIAQR